MLFPALPCNELQRMDALCGLNLLDTPADERFDRITRIAQSYFKVSIALVTLVDAQRQWFKSNQGLDATETSRDISFCGHAILGDDVFYVPNTLMDGRFSDNPLVTGPPNIRFYAGAPLAAPDGSKVGTLCVIDTQPRTFSQADFGFLRDLAGLVEDELTRDQKLTKAIQGAEAMAQLAAIIESSDDAIISKTLDGVITGWNHAAERLFGYAAHEVMGQPMALLIPPDRIEEESKVLRRIVRGERIQHFDSVRLRKDGTRIDISASISPIRDGTGKITSVSNIARDISERKVHERMKSEFVSTVSHELRTPLTSIRGALGLVLGKFSSTLPDKARLLLETANRNSLRLTLLINDILDLEKFESGQMDLDLKTLDLVSLVRQAMTANEGYAHEHTVQLRLVQAPEVASVRADEHRMSQVFANLLSNAIKYSPQGGEVDVSVLANASFFRVSVRDHGRGIPQAFRARIFQRFSQADSSDTREKGGTGLGLSITKAIVEKHGGHIDYVSAEGDGCDFYFEMPAWHEITEQAEEQDTRPCMLICEDNPDVAMVLSEVLEHEGIASDRVATATAAIELLSRKNYRALLLDLGLPDMDGRDLIQHLRGDDATRNVPIIVVSGRARGDFEFSNGEALEVLDWLQKPVDRARLRQALAQAQRKTKLPRVLHVEDDADVVEVIRSVLEDTVDYVYASTLAQARQRLTQEHFDLVLLDLSLPDGSGADLIVDIGIDTQVVMFSGAEPSPVFCKQVRAALTKSTTSNERLLATIKNVLDRNGVDA